MEYIYKNLNNKTLLLGFLGMASLFFYGLFFGGASVGLTIITIIIFTISLYCDVDELFVGVIVSSIFYSTFSSFHILDDGMLYMGLGHITLTFIIFISFSILIILSLVALGIRMKRPVRLF